MTFKYYNTVTTYESSYEGEEFEITKDDNGYIDIFWMDNIAKNKTNEEMEEIESDIVKQFEIYLSDRNI